MPHHLHLVIDSNRQEMSVFDSAGHLIRHFPVSTGKAGMGFENGSGKTPTGKFRVSEKITSPSGIHTIFKSRIPCGAWPDDLPDGSPPQSDFILTGILWLDGLEEANANTRERYIYIHGTHHTNLLGTPASQGCVRLAPDDMQELLEMTGEGTLVDII